MQGYTLEKFPVHHTARYRQTTTHGDCHSYDQCGVTISPNADVSGLSEETEENVQSALKGSGFEAGSF